MTVTCESQVTATDRVLRQAASELGDAAGPPPTAAEVAIAAAAEKKKLEELVHNMIAKHQNCLAERTVAMDAKEQAEAELARLRDTVSSLEATHAHAAQAELQAAVHAKELELRKLQDKIKEFAGAAKGELDRKQAALAAQESAADLLQLRLASQRATCISALRSRSSRSLRSRYFFEWVRRSVALLAHNAIDSPGQRGQKREVSETRNPAFMCEKFRSLVSSTFGGHRPELFELHDQDRDGRWSYSEFRRAVRRSAHVTEFAMSDAELRVVFDDCDDYGVGLITIEQLHSMVVLPAGILSGTSSPTVGVSAAAAQRRLRPPPRNSKAMESLRRSAASANRRVREFEAATEDRSTLLAVMHHWRAFTATAQRATVVRVIIGSLQSSNTIRAAFSEWASEMHWRRRACRVVMRRRLKADRAALRASFTRWVGWREQLAMERLAGAVKICQEERQHWKQQTARADQAQKAVAVQQKRKEKQEQKDEAAKLERQGNAVNARKQLLDKAAKSERDAVDAKRRATDLADAVKIMTVRLQKSEAAVLELSDLVAFSKYGGGSDNTKPTVERADKTAKVETKAAVASTSDIGGSTDSRCTPKRSARSSSSSKKKITRKPPASHPLDRTVSLRTEFEQKLGLVIDKSSSAPCTIGKVTVGSLAEQARLKPGDAVIAVQGESLEDCKYSAVVAAIKRAAADQGTLELTIRIPVDKELECRTDKRRAAVTSCRLGICSKTRSAPAEHATPTKQPAHVTNQRAKSESSITGGICSPVLTLEPCSDQSSDGSSSGGGGSSDDETQTEDAEKFPVIELAPLSLEVADEEDDDGCTGTGMRLSLEAVEVGVEKAPKRWGPEVVDPFACMKDRQGPEQCRTSAKEALHHEPAGHGLHRGRDTAVF